jgi:hypothetical protein
VSVTPPSSWPWIDHLVSGLRPATHAPYSDSVSLRLPYPVKLATERKSLTHYTKGTQSPLLQKLCFRRSRDQESGIRNQQELAAQRAAKLNLIPDSRFPIPAPPPSAKRLEEGLPLFVCMRFQDLFHSPPGVLFAFPSRYWFTIGRSRVFSLGGWSPHLQTGFLVSRPTCRKPSPTAGFSRTGLSPSLASLSRPFH